MSLSPHDELVELLSRTILNKYKQLFKDVFIANVSMDFPKPDFIYIPVSAEKQNPIAFEVKTPFVHKHEYVAGIGQTVCYNSFFPLSYYVIPNINVERFSVSNFILSIVRTNDLSIGVFTYEMNKPENIELLKEASIVKINTEQLKESIKYIRRSYSYWRETLPEEVFDALRFSSELENSNEQNIFVRVLEKLWENTLSKRFLKAERKGSFLLNYKLFLVQNALLDANGRLTIIGRHALALGERFSKDSETFREIITYIILKYGGHYSLLSKIYKEQEKMSDKELSNWERWVEKIVESLKEQNYYISKDDFRVDYPRMLYAYEKYFCGIAKRAFNEGKGIIVNYPKIVEILDKGSRLFLPIESTLSF
ncbi:MAG: hypothetical protein ACP5IT_12070 [Thermoproteota archaeon]